MRLRPFGAQHETAGGDYALAYRQSFQQRIETIALCAYTDRTHDEFGWFVSCDEDHSLIVDCLDGIFRYARSTLFRYAERAESDVHIHANLEHLPGIRQFDSHLRSSGRGIDLRIDVSHAATKHLSRIGVRSHIRAAADAHGREILFIDLTDNPHGRQIGDPHQLLVCFDHFAGINRAAGDCARVWRYYIHL